MNEVNFDIVAKYLSLKVSRYPEMQKMLSGVNIRTTSEDRYEYLEPWIQWVSVHTGMSFNEHKVFRLGDMVGSDIPQIFEELEQNKYVIGVISAMNTENRLKAAAYFIPDPWTQTPPDKSWWSNALSQAISQAVNDNSQSKITIKSYMQIIAGWFRFARLINYPVYFRLALHAVKRPWYKALILDLLLHDIHLNFFKGKKPNFSTLFLNAGAHIQHHYFFNSEPVKKEHGLSNPEWYVSKEEDPVADVLKLYDRILGQIFSIKNVEILVCTALTQNPFDRIKFYYRLRNHASFLQKVGINFKSVLPRMTRDFVIEFFTEEEALSAKKILSNLFSGKDNARLFNEIDNRGLSLFVTLTYQSEITNDEVVLQGEKEMFRLKPEVSFVAIKNGMHNPQGFAFFSDGLVKFSPKNFSHVSSLNKTIKNFFNVV